MRIGRLVTLTGGLLLAASAMAGAQEAGKAGISIGYPSAIGVLWHATESIAIRPDFTFTHTSSDTSSGWAYGTNISVLFYLKKYDNVRAYVSPRFSYTRNSTTSTPVVSTLPGAVLVPPITITGSTTGGAGTFGVQAWSGSHFSAFGEVGIAFSQRTTESVLTGLGNLKSKLWGTTAGVGVVFYP
jgi:hypothetical protein